MKSMKKILSLVIALAMVLSVAPIAMAVAGDDGMGGVETEYFWDDFQSVVSDSFPRVLGLTETINGWKRNSVTPEQQYSFEKEGDNIYLQYQNTTGQQNEREISKSLNGTIAAGSNVRITLKYKYPSGAANVFGLYIFGQEFYFRPNVGNFYPGVAGSTQFNNAIIPNKWNNIELLLLSKDDADYYEYYLEGKLISTGKLASRMASSSSLWLRQKLNNAGVTQVKDKYVCFDDIKITTVDEKRICELAAERISVPSSATSNITLPTSSYGGATISWTSSNTSLISNGGVVTRPESGEIQPVTLTATVTYGTTSVAYPYTVNVLPHTVPFYEDFEGAAIGDVAGYNSWSEGQRRGYPNGTLCWDWSIKQETAANKTANVVKTVDTATVVPEGSNNNINVNQVVREFDEISGKNVRVTAKFKTDYVYNNFEIILEGNTTHYFVFRATNATDNGGYLNGGSKTNDYTLKENVWQTLTFDLDLVNGKYDLYVDENQVANDYNYNGGTALTSLKKIGLSLNFASWGGVGSSVDFDDIVVTTGKPEYAYSIVDFAFKGADGAASLYPEAGGSVSSVTIKKYDTAENAALIAAVYDGGKLTKASAPIDITGVLINAEKTYPVSLPIASENTEIRVFALDKGTLVPLALDKTYEKRSPITVFIAGDSMAEDVPDDISSKTLKEYSVTVSYQRAGWGDKIKSLFNADATVVNKSVGGQSAATFLVERYSPILASAQRGDYVLISFGHNDQGKNTADEATYKANLKAFSEKAKAVGLIPIFISPITRLTVGADDIFTPDAGLATLAGYMEAVAKETGDVYLDLNAAFSKEMEGKTSAQLREYYVDEMGKAEEDGEDYPIGDYTHLDTNGATFAAGLIANLLSASSSTLKDLLK